jgi:hypothetical protein
MVPETWIILSPFMKKRQAMRFVQWSRGTLMRTFPMFMYFICREKVIFARKS